MPHNLNNYLRTHRRRAGLSQDEVAFLLGCRCGSNASRYERFARAPSLETAFMFEVLFGTPARDLFRGLYEKVEKDVTGRARLLAQRLVREAPARSVSRKLATLGKIVSLPKPDGTS